MSGTHESSDLRQDLVVRHALVWSQIGSHIGANCHQRASTCDSSRQVYSRQLDKRSLPMSSPFSRPVL